MGFRSGNSSFATAAKIVIVASDIFNLLVSDNSRDLPSQCCAHWLSIIVCCPSEQIEAASITNEGCPLDAFNKEN